MTNPISPFLPPLNEEALSFWEIGCYAESNRNRRRENHGGWDGGGGWWRETWKPQKEIDDRKQGKEESIVWASELLRISGIHVLHGQKTHQRRASSSWRACHLQLVKGRISFSSNISSRTQGLNTLLSCCWSLIRRTHEIQPWSGW